MNRYTIINTLKSNKTALIEKFSIKDIGLFGSYAKNIASLKSDIDLVYTLEKGKRFGFKEVYEFEQFMQQLFKEKTLDLVNKKYMNPIIAAEAEKSIIYV